MHGLVYPPPEPAQLSAAERRFCSSTDNRQSLQKKAQPSPNPAKALEGAAARAAVGADATAVFTQCRS